MDRHWNRNPVSLVFFVATVMPLPISWIRSMEDWFQVPAVSTDTGKRSERQTARHTLVLFAAALLAAEHASLAVWSMCDSAYMSGTVISDAMGLPHNQGYTPHGVAPSGHFPSCYRKLIGSLVAII